MDSLPNSNENLSSATTNFLNLLTNSRHTNNANNSILSEVSSTSQQPSNNNINNTEESNSNLRRLKKNEKTEENNLMLENKTRTEDDQSLLGKKRSGDDVPNERLESNENRANTIQSNGINFDNYPEPPTLTHDGLLEDLRSVDMNFSSDLDNTTQNQENNNRRDHINLNRNRINSEDASSYEIIVEEFYENENEAEEDESNLDEI
jgi:hypothetical protein